MRTQEELIALAWAGPYDTIELTDDEALAWLLGNRDEMDYLPVEFRVKGYGTSGFCDNCASLGIPRYDHCQCWSGVGDEDAESLVDEDWTELEPMPHWTGYAIALRDMHWPEAQRRLEARR